MTKRQFRNRIIWTAIKKMTRIKLVNGGSDVILKGS